GRPKAPAELSQHRCLAFQRRASIDRTHPGSKVWVFQKDGETLRVPVSGAFRSNSGDALIAAAKAHYGIVLVPRWLVAEHLDDGSITALLDDYQVHPEALDNAVHVVYPSARFLSPKVRAFVDFLVERIAI
ncbi:MAG: substrate binding domain-containing protein, partial [Burkholderiaceae bacterium]